MRLHRRHARPVRRHADENPVGAAELARSHRDCLRIDLQLLKFLGGPCAEHGRRPKRCFRRGQVGNRDIANLGVEHLRRAAFDRDAQLHLAWFGVERDACRPASAGR